MTVELTCAPQAALRRVVVVVVGVMWYLALPMDRMIPHIIITHLRKS